MKRSSKKKHLTYRSIEHLFYLKATGTSNPCAKKITQHDFDSPIGISEKPLKLRLKVTPFIYYA